jgi:hypothetical protein
MIEGHRVVLPRGWPLARAKRTETSTASAVARKMFQPGRLVTTARRFVLSLWALTLLTIDCGSGQLSAWGANWCRFIF